MKVAGGKLGETRRTHRIGGRCARAPAGRMRLAVGTFVMRPAGARVVLVDGVRWVRLSLRSWLPTGYLHWPRWGRRWSASAFYSTGNSEETTQRRQGAKMEREARRGLRQSRSPLPVSRKGAQRIYLTKSD